MKKQMLAETAANLYIEKFMTLETIAKQLNVSERTLQRWKTEGNWNEKRSEYLKSNTTFQEDLYSFGKKLLDSIMSDMSNGKKVEPSRLYTVTKIINMLKNVKTYEDSAVTKKCEMETSKSVRLSPDVIREIEEKILGITYND